VRRIAVLMLFYLFASCNDRTKREIYFNKEEAKYYENGRTDTTRYSPGHTSYRKLCEDLFLLAYTPVESMLTGAPGSYRERISQSPDYTRDEFERLSREVQGKFYIDTAGRDFEKYWYNDKGLLERFENRKFGDMLHTECIFFYHQNDLIREIEINDILGMVSYRSRTVKIGANQSVILLKHYIGE
jgi:hypothetical protein